jgi:uncharacterized protein Usg
MMDELDQNTIGYQNTLAMSLDYAIPDIFELLQYFTWGSIKIIGNFSLQLRCKRWILLTKISINYILQYPR